MRIEALDGLRGFAIILVMIFHTFLPYTYGGFIGVDIFFVLSGFLITSLLIKEFEAKGAINFKKFYMRRFLRLAPALLIVVVSFYIYSQLFLTGDKKEGALIASLGALFYISNLASAYDWFVMSYLLPTWSLSIEEQFYLVWPLLFSVLLLFAKNKRTILMTMIIMILLVWLNRIALTLNDASIKRLYFGTDTRIDGLLVGSLTAFLVAWCDPGSNKIVNTFLRFNRVLPLLALGYFSISMVAFAKDMKIVYIAQLPLVEIITAILIVAIYLRKDNQPTLLLSNKYLVWLGSISYSVYLWNWFMYRILANLGMQGVSAAATGIALTIVAASLSYYLVEKPVLKLKSKYQP